jgi:hypothetical protein
MQADHSFLNIKSFMVFQISVFSIFLLLLAVRQFLGLTSFFKIS